MHMGEPDRIYAGLLKEIGWENRAINRHSYVVPTTTLGELVGLGRDQMPMELMRDDNLDVIVCGEITEWTLCAYVNDAQMLGMNKALLILGHERTEESGMKYMADWLKPLVNDIPVHFVDAQEPFTYL